MAVPDFQTLMLPVLRATAEGEISSAELRESVAQALKLTQDDLAELLPSGKLTKFANRIAWANIFLQRALLIEKARRGVYRITPEGTAALNSNPARIDMRSLERYPAYVEWRKSGGAVTSDPTASTAAAGNIADATPEEQIERSHTALIAALRAELLEHVLDQSPAFFEKLIIELLIQMGYGGGREEMGKALGRSGDGGIDGVIKEDPLGLDVVYMQAKRYAPGNSVGRQEVQAFAGSLEGHRATKGIFFTTSSFSRGAEEYVEKISKRIVLVDGPELARLMVAHNVGVRVQTTYEIKKVDDDFFSE